MRIAMAILSALVSVARAGDLVERERVTILVPGGARVTIDDSERLVALARDIKHDAATAKDCPRVNAKNAKWLSARIEAPRPGDPVIVVEPTTAPWIIMAAVARLDVPAAIAVRDAAGTEQVLAVRWCARSSEVPSVVASGIDVISTQEGVVVGPSSGGDRARVARISEALDPGRLAETMRAQAGGRAIAMVRVGITSYARRDLSTILAAARESGAREIALVPELAGGPAFVVKLGNTSTDGSVDKGAARAAAMGRIADIGECVHRVAFIDPKLAGTVRLSFAVATDGTLRPTTNKPNAFARCAGDVLAKASLVGSEAGSFSTTLVIEPYGPWSVTPQPNRQLTGNGGF